jgi:DNA-damage-inducible protein J
MAQTNINIRMDEDLKREFDSLCKDLGLTMTAAFTIFAKTVVRRQRIPFDIAKDVPNAETIAAIEEVQAMKKDPNKRLYSNFGELLKEVEADV